MDGMVIVAGGCFWLSLVTYPISQAVSHLTLILYYLSAITLRLSHLVWEARDIDGMALSPD